MDYDLSVSCVSQLLQQGGSFADYAAVHTLNTQLSFYTVVSSMQYNVVKCFILLSWKIE